MIDLSAKLTKSSPTFATASQAPKDTMCAPVISGDGSLRAKRASRCWNWQSLMPTGPKGEKRPADVIGNALKVVWIAIGEETAHVPAKKARAV